MSTAYLASTALMGVLAVAVVVWMMRGRGWYQYRPTESTGDWSPALDRTGRLEAMAGRPMTWVVAFAVLVVGFVLGVVAAISGPVESQATAGLAVAVAGGLLALSGFLVFAVNVLLVVRDHSPTSLVGILAPSVAGVDPADVGDAE